MIEYVQKMSACDESKVATSTHLYPKGQRTERRIKSDLVKIFAGCFATAKKLNGRGLERDIGYSSYSFLLVPANWEPGTSWDLTKERVKIYRLAQLRNLNSNLISRNWKYTKKITIVQNYLHIQYGCQPAIQVSFILYANVPVHDESKWNG